MILNKGGRRVHLNLTFFRSTNWTENSSVSSAAAPVTCKIRVISKLSQSSCLAPWRQYILSFLALSITSRSGIYIRSQANLVFPLDGTSTTHSCAPYIKARRPLRLISLALLSRSNSSSKSCTTRNAPSCPGYLAVWEGRWRRHTRYFWGAPLPHFSQHWS
jgi:hypothetical protein